MAIDFLIEHSHYRSDFFQSVIFTRLTRGIKCYLTDSFTSHLRLNYCLRESIGSKRGGGYKFNNSVPIHLCIDLQNTW